MYICFFPTTRFRHREIKNGGPTSSMSRFVQIADYIGAYIPSRITAVQSDTLKSTVCDLTDEKLGGGHFHIVLYTCATRDTRKGVVL